MNTESIKKIWIDNQYRLCVKPQKETYEQIYRSAMDVHWNQEKCYLYTPSNSSRSPFEWFNQIVLAVKTEYGSQLYITEETQWENIKESLKTAIYMVGTTQI